MKAAFTRRAASRAVLTGFAAALVPSLGVSIADAQQLPSAPGGVAPPSAPPATAPPAAAQPSGQPEIWQARRPDFPTNVLALGGFDPVAFHTQNAAVAGTGNFRVSWKGAEWHFATQSNRDLFARDPDRYAPQYGGWCAFAVAAGARAASDPRFFDVVNGRLYMNQSAGTQASWRRDQAGMIHRGDQNWPRILGR
jgi:YHS domain-containing protein